MDFLPQTLIVKKLIDVTNNLLPTLPESDNKQLLIDALREFKKAITPSAVFLEEVHERALEQNIKVTNQQALQILENSASDINSNYANQAIDYHIDQFTVD